MTMKRTVKIIVSAIALTLVLSACSPLRKLPSLPGLNLNDPTTKETIDSADNGWRTEDSSESKATQVSQPSKGNAAGDTSGWASFYERYMERMSEGSNALIEAATESNPMLGLHFLSLMEGDIEMAFTSAFFAADSAEVLPFVFGMFGGSNFKYETKGDTARMSFTNSEEESMVYTLRFDGKNTAQLTSELNGSTRTVMDIFLTDEYAAKSVYNVEKSTLTRMVVLTNGDVFAGFGSSKQPPALYGDPAAPSRADFLEGLESTMSYKNGNFESNIK